MKLALRTAVFFFFFLAAAFAQQDPFNGSWKLNVAKSTMQPATASKSEIIHYQIVDDEERFVSEAVTAKDESDQNSLTRFKFLLYSVAAGLTGAYSIC